MELTDGDLEIIRGVVRDVDYGSVTINCSAVSNKLNLSVQKRIRFEPEQTVVTMGVDVQKGKTVCAVKKHGPWKGNKPVK
jgi:hypothetical protein